MARILVVGRGDPERGGIAAYLRELMASDLRERHDLRFLNLTPTGEQHGGRLSMSNVTRTLGDTIAVARQARGCDVVHIHSALAPTVTALRASLFAVAARLRGARPIVHAHGGRVVVTASSRRRWLLRVLLRPAAVVVAVAASVAETLAGVVDRARLAVIPNGVDVARFSPADEPASRTPPAVLYAGLLTPRKGVLDLIEASAQLRGRGIDHELLIAGGTPDEGAEAEREVRAALPDAGVRLLGVIAPEDMPDLYRSCDVFCLPSWWEAMPLTVLEAMSSGLPVVATDVGDVARMLDGGRCGVIVPPSAPDALADALASLLVDGDRRDRIGAVARDHVLASYDWSTTLARLDALYDRLAASR